MRSFSACRRCLPAATVIGVGLFSMPTLAATVTPLPTTYDWAAKTMTIGVGIVDGSGMGSVLFYECFNTDGSGCYPIRGGEVSNGVVLITNRLLRPGAHTITATYNAEDPDPLRNETLSGRVTYVIEVPAWPWELIPIVLDSLSD